MVAVVVGLRLRSMAHLMVREWWRLLVLVAGALWMFTLVPGVVWARGALAHAAAYDRDTAMAVIGVFSVVGWALVPVMVAGGDDTLDPRRFATAGVRARRLMPGLVVASLLTLPALFFGFAWFMLATSWFAEDAAVGSLALAGAVVQTLSLVAIARVAASWAARVLANRRTRVLALAVAALTFCGFAYAAWRALNRGLETLFATDFDTLAAAIARTPIVSAVTAPAAAAEGDWGRAWLLLAMGAAWMLLLLVVWRQGADRALVTPAYRSAGLRTRPDAVVGAGGRVAFLSAADRRGPAGAVYARVARAWRMDPRYLTSLIAVILLPAMFVMAVIPAFHLDTRWALAAPFLLATSIGWGRHNDVAYDSTALWLDVVAGRRGAAVMRGRFAGVAVWGAPVVVVCAVAVAVWIGHAELAPPVAGAAAGALGVSLGVAALTSVLLPYRTPAPGENPFGAEVGAVGAGLVGQLASSGATLVLLPLVIVPCVLAITVDARWGIVAAVSGLALGAAAYAWGLTLAGRIYDSRSGRLLAAVR